MEVRPQGGLHTHPAGLRRFEVRAGRAPRLRMQVTYQRDGYGPGDEVTATVSVLRGSGQPARGASVRAVARLDGEVVHEADCPPPDTAFGETKTTFRLPAAIARGVGTLSFVVDDGGVVETVGKTLPILLQAVDVDVYPEGGDLVHGVPTRVYVEARTPVGDPADITAEIRQAGDSLFASAVATVTTVHEGRGVSTTFAPLHGTQYELVVTAPTGVSRAVPLPPVLPTGAGVTVASGVIDAGNPVVVKVAAAPGAVQVYQVVLYKREQEIASTIVDLSARGATGVVHLTPPSTAAADGVLRVTVYCHDSGIPVAERLVYRRPRASLQVDVTADAAHYAPGDTVTLTVRTVGPDGAAVPSVLGVAVVDATVEESLPRRRLPPRLPVQALLEDEVAHLTDPRAYHVMGDTPLTPTRTPEDDVPLDLVLGTQGWRRFVYTDAAAAFKAVSPDADTDDTYIGDGDGDGDGDAAGATSPNPAWDAAAMHTPTDTTRMDILQRLMAVCPQPPRPKRFVARNGGGMFGNVMEMAMPAMAMRAGAPAPMAAMAAMPEMPEMDGDAPMEAGAVMEDAAMDMAMPMAMDAGAMEAPEDQMAFGEEDAPPPAMPAMPPRMPAADQPIEPDMPIMGKRAHRRRPDRVGVMRYYSHHGPPTARDDGARTDFTTTLLWAAGHPTEVNGVASLSFKMCDSVTAFHVVVDAYTQDGMLGQGDATVLSMLPLRTEVKLPLQLTLGDRPEFDVTTLIPALEAVAGGAAAAPHDVSLHATGAGGLAVAAVDEEWSQSARGHTTRVPAIVTGAGPNTALVVAVTDATTGATDRLVSALDVSAGGFPVDDSVGGLLKAGGAAGAAGAATHAVVLPDTVLPGSLNVSAVVYPTPVASLTQALEALIRTPCGCFEQTSGTVYPLIMAQKYFKTHSGVDPDLIARAEQQLAAGYAKLASFESAGGGFEWFGGTPAHEALTAYGALEFHELSQVWDGVDEALLQRTRQWLRGRADGAGGFKRSPQALDSFGRAPQTVTDLYIVWALVTAGERGLDKEVDAAWKEVNNPASDHSTDPYYIGLEAATLYELGRTDDADALSRRLVAQQGQDGHVAGALTSITCSRGQSLAIESTAVAVLAWLHNTDEFAGHAQRAMQWLVAQCQNGRFGSTQGTVLALKAIIAYDVATSRPTAPGRVVVSVAGADVSTAAFDKDTKGALQLDGAAIRAALQLGSSNDVAVRLESDDSAASMPFSLQVAYATHLPPSAAAVPVTIATKLSSRTMRVGDPGTVSVAVTNNEPDTDQPMLVAVVGLPGGLEPRHEQLRELVSSGAIAFYEQMGRDIVLYWRGMAAGGTLSVQLDVVATVAGSFSGDASRAYLYYTDELKSWVPGLAVTVE